MAEVLVSALVKVLIEKMAGAFLEKLAGAFLEELGLAADVKKDLEKLKGKLLRIEALMKDAEEQQAANNVLKECLSNLKDVAYDANDILDDFSTRALRRKVENTGFPFHIFNSNPAGQIKDILKRIDEIQKDMSELHLKTGFSRVRVEFGERKETDSLNPGPQVRGRRGEHEKIVHMLINGGNEADISVIPIVGIGGLGKTSLAQFIYNDKRVTKHFNLKMWVFVPEDFDIKELARKIIASATGKNCNLSDMDLLQSNLRRSLSRKRYLLVLDDVWNENKGKWQDLKHLLRNGGAAGSKVMVTTRSKMIAKFMGTLPAHDLKILSEDDCWHLFKQQALQPEDEKKFPKLVEIGKAIVKKCKGVPLAAKSLGQSLQSTRRESKWLATRDEEIWESKENEILPVLRLSYVHLPAHLKQCFVYCSIFPKDYIFDKDRLIQLWMAEGLLPSGSSRLMEDIGAEYFDELCQRSFFQDAVESKHYGPTVQWKMHDLLNDLARSIAGAECSTLNIGMEENIQESARYSLLVCDKKSEQIKSEFFHKAKKLRTFIILGKDAISSGPKRSRLSLVPRDFVSLRCLRVLDLNRTSITKLPKSMGNLLHLRYLDLSFTPIERLPSSICSLCNLQTLKLSYCSVLLELPKSMGNLLHLRYLDLSFTPIERLPSSICSLCNLQTLKLRGCDDLLELPKDMRKMISLRHLEIFGQSRVTAMPSRIGQLCDLQTLPFFIVGREKGCGIEELQGLNHLRGELEIRNLENVIDPVNAQKADLKEKKNLRSLKLMWSKDSYRGAGDTDVIEYLQPHSNLKELCIVDYNGSSFPNWMTGLHLSLLRFLNLEQWSNSPKLPRVKELHIYCCPKLSRLPRLPRLTKLELQDSNETLLRSVANCTRLSYLKIDHFAKTVSLPKGMLQNHNLLRSLHIENCPQLKSLSKDLNSLASLEHLELLALPKLNSLPDKIENLTSLKTLRLGKCPGIKCLPAGLQHLTSLLRLSIYGCIGLQRRCRKKGGKDWHKIQRIPKIYLEHILQKESKRKG